MADKIDTAEGDSTFVSDADRAKAKADSKSVSEDTKKPEDGMEVFGSDPEVVKFSIGEVSFAPMKVGQIRRFMAESGKLIPAINAMVQADGSINLSELQRLDQTALMSGIGIAVNCKISQLDEMELPEFIRLVTKVFLVNFDFFIQAIPQVLGVVAASLTKVMIDRGDGHTPFNGSSGPVTPSQKLTGTP